MMSLILMLSFVCSIRANEMDPLLETLIEKGVLSQEEAKKIEAETEKKEKNTGDNCGGFFSIKGENCDIGGALVLRYVDADSDSHKKNSRLELAKFLLCPKITLSKDVTFKSTIKATSDKTIAEDAYIVFSNLPFHSFVQAGLACRFMSIGCKTDELPLIGRAFWDDEDVAVHLGGSLNWLYWRLSVANGQELGTAYIGNDKAYELIADDRQTSDSNYNKEIGTGVGLKSKLGDSASFNLLGFYYTGELSDDDITFLQGIAGYGTSTDDTKAMYGGRAVLNVRDFTLIAEYIAGEDGELDRDGWYIQPSYKVKFSNLKWFHTYELVLRYDELNVDLDNNPADSLTWDRDMITIGLNTHIKKNVIFVTEYSINDEDTGNGDVDNNEFLLKLVAKF